MHVITLVKDIQTAAGVFKDIRDARRDGGNAVFYKMIQFPHIGSNPGFFNTVEGCCLWGAVDHETFDAVNDLFKTFPYEVAHGLELSPKDGEYVERIKFWRETLKPYLTRNQYRIAMTAIYEWFIHIKRDLRREKDD